MPYRTFVDSTGTEWQVWDVVPRLSERRDDELADRRLEPAPIRFADRREDDRRLAQMQRSVLCGTSAHGWLCFDNSEEKRRLAPIPRDWTSCSDELLERYERHAEPVTGTHRAAGFSGEEPLAEKTG